MNAKVSKVLRYDPAITDSHLIERYSKETDKMEYLCYVAAREVFDVKKLHKYLVDEIPELDPCQVIVVPRLPLRSDGSVDELCLASLPVIDETVQSRWDSALSELAGIERVRVVQEPLKKEPLELLHLKDVLPDAQLRSPRNGLETPSLIDEAGAVLAVPGAMAYSNGGPLSIPDDAPKTISEALQLTAHRYPNKGIWFAEMEGEETFLSYASLLEDSSRVLGSLQANGLKPNDPVIIQMEDMRNHITTFWACVLGGIVPVNIAVPPTMDRNNGVVKKLHNTWKILGRPTLLTQQHLQEPLTSLLYCDSDLSGTTQAPRKTPRALAIEDLQNGNCDGELHNVQPNDLVFYQLSSGSTGIPKVIQVRHTGVVHHIHGSQQFLGHTNNDVSLNWLTMDHVVSILTFNIKDTYLGCNQIFVKLNLIIANPLYWIELIDKYRVTHTWSPNFAFKLVYDAIVKERGRSWDLSCLKFVMNAGEQVTLPVVKSFLEKTAPYGFNPKAMVPAFGMAEVCTCMTYNNNFDVEKSVYCVAKSSLSERLRTGNSSHSASFVDLGAVMPGVEIRITNKKNEIVEEGVIGRLQIRGVVTTPGYYNNDTANEEAFVGDGWFDSGDLGFMLNSHLVLTGRSKEMIIIRGSNFYCHEIEDVVNQLPSVMPTFTGASATHDPNIGTEALAIFFVPRHDSTEYLVQAVRDVRTAVAGHLGLQADVVVPLTRERFPKTTSGKIQRRQLRSSLEMGKFDDILRRLDLALGNENTLPSWFDKMVWVPKQPRIYQERDPQKVIIFWQESELSYNLLARIGRESVVRVDRGATFVQHDMNHFQINPSREADYESLFSIVFGRTSTITSMIHLWNLDATDVSSEKAALDQSVFSIMSIVKQCAHHRKDTQESRLLVVGAEMLSVSEDDPLDPNRAILSGLVPVICQEYNWLDCRCLDLSDADALRGVEHVLAELFDTSRETSVAVRRCQRLVPRFKRIDIMARDKKEPLIINGGMYLLTGGMGGIGLELARFMVSNFSVRLLITGRRSSSELYAKELAKLHEVAAISSSHVQYVAADVTSLVELEEAVANAEKAWQTGLTGVFNLAGISTMKLLAEESRDSFAAVLQPKVNGSRVIERLLQSRPKAFVVHFSSINAFFGGFMLGAYSAANCFLNAFAHEQRRKQRKSYCICWSLWKGVGMNRNAAVTERARTMGYCSLSAPQGIRSMQVALQLNEPELWIGLDHRQAHINRWLTGPIAPQQQLTGYYQGMVLHEQAALSITDRFGTKTSCELQQVKQLPLSADGSADHESLKTQFTGRVLTGHVIEPSSPLEQTLLSIWKELLPIGQIDTTDNFFEVGGNSLLLMQVQSRLQALLNRKIDSMTLFQYPTIETLARYLAGQRLDTSKTVTIDRRRTDDIAIIGLAGRFPLASTISEFWEHLIHSRDCTTHFTDQQLGESGVPESLLSSPGYVKSAPVLQDVDRFAADFFGIPAEEARRMDPQQRLFLETAWEAIEDAGYVPSTYEGRIGVFGSISLNTYGSQLDASPHLGMGFINDMVSLDKDFVTTRVSYKLNLTGPSINIQTACSSSLVAVHQACKSLLNGEAEMALAGAMSVRVPHHAGYLHQQGGIFSADGHCRPFDADASGMVFGNGGGMVLLKPLRNALRDGDSVRAVIKGTAINNDGSRKVGYSAPSIDGQAAALQSALDSANVPARSVSYIETHGTATTLGDPIEFAAIRDVYGENGRRQTRCALGSVKSNIGHLDVAAGMAGLIKTVLMLEKRQLVPTMHFKRPNPKLDIDKTVFFVNTETQAWQMEGQPLRAAVSAFGFGGTNSHVVLEEAPVMMSNNSLSSWQVLPLAAKSPKALCQMRKNLADYLRRNPDSQLPDVAWTLQIGRSHFSYRDILVCDSVTNATALLEDQANIASIATTAEKPQIVFLFPGQGAQRLNMSLDLYRNIPLFAKQLDECLDQASLLLGRDIRKLLFSPEEPLKNAEEILRQTDIAQPVLFSIEYALAKLWMAWGVRPAAMAGHSLGEYTAACLAGVFSLEDALKIVVRRGQLLQQLPPGAMLAVPMSAEELREKFGCFAVAAENSPRHSVVAGTPEEIETLQKLLQRKGVTGKMLEVSRAFHSHLLEPVLPAFKDAFRDIKLFPPSIPYVSNVTGNWISKQEAQSPEYWARHMRQTVRFSENVKTLLNADYSLFLEVGPGRTLSNMSRKHTEVSERAKFVASLDHTLSCGSGIVACLRAVGELFKEGVEIDWHALHEGCPKRRVPLPTYPFERESYWIKTTRKLSSRACVKPKMNDLDKSPCIDDWFYLPTWQRTAPLTVAESGDDQSWLVFTDESWQIEGLIEQLKSSRQQVAIVSRSCGFFHDDLECQYAIDPQSEADYIKLIRHLRETHFFPKRIIFCWAAASKDNPSQEECVRMKSEGFYGLLNLTRSCSRAGWDQELKVAVVTRALHDVTGCEQLEPTQALILGAIKVIPQEYPNMRCLAVDLDSSTVKPSRASNRHLIAELCHATDAATVVSFRGGHRWTQQFSPVKAHAAKSIPHRLHQDGVYWITGGLGAVGLELAEYLASSCQARLVLSSRRGLPDRSQWDALLQDAAESGIATVIRRVRHLEALGSKVTILAADVADRSAMQQCLERILEEYGEIHGVVHGAGLLHEQSFRHIKDLSEKDCEQHFEPKIQGLQNLATILPPNVEWVICLSSLSAILGGLGAAAYAAANAFMDAFIQAQNRQQGNTFWHSTNWDAWLINSHPESNSSFANIRFNKEISSKARLAITPEEAGDVWNRVFDLPEISQIAVSTCSLDHRLAQWVHLESLDDKAQQERKGLQQKPVMYQKGKNVSATNEVERTVVEIWQDLLGVAPIRKQDNFFQLGGDSLLSIQLGTRLRKELNVEFSVYDLFEAPTLEAFSSRLKEAMENVSKTRTDDYSQNHQRSVENQILTHQFQVETGASSESRKHQMQTFYNAINQDLNSTDVGDFSYFLNYGYAATNSDRKQSSSVIELPPNVISRNSIQLVLEVIGSCPIASSTRILDVGCGRGGTIHVLRRYFTAGEVVGVDLSTEAIEFCSTQHRFPNTRFVEGDAEQLPFSDCSFDVITNIESAHSYPRLFQFYQQVARLLKPGGYFLYTDLFSTESATDFLYEGTPPTPTPATCVKALEALGMTVLTNRNITSNVLKSCDQVAARHAASYATSSKFSKKLMDDFLAKPGSKVYKDMELGLTEYRILAVQKPFNCPAKVPHSVILPLHDAGTMAHSSPQKVKARPVSAS